jgi:hypothetical protein
VKQFGRMWVWDARIVPAVEIGSDPKSGLGWGSTDIVEDLLVRIQPFARPVGETSEKRRCSMGFHLEAPVG